MRHLAHHTSRAQKLESSPCGIADVFAERVADKRHSDPAGIDSEMKFDREVPEEELADSLKSLGGHALWNTRKDASERRRSSGAFV